MDIEMDIDYDASVQPAAPQYTQQENDPVPEDTLMPAAYYEDLNPNPRPSRQYEQWPDHLNLQGVDNFDPDEAVYYLVKSGVVDQQVKQTRWINDSSLNLQFYSAEDAAIALQLLTHPDAGDPVSIPPETARKARPWKDRELTIRQANSGDQKVRGAANHSRYYEKNPDVRGGDRRGDRRGDRGREREPQRRPPPRRDFLDYGDDEPVRSNRRSRSGDEQMRNDSDYETRRARRNPGERDGRDGRLRAPADVDSYRPGSTSPRESRFGRLRGRSASPAFGDEGDGRYGFTEQGTSTRRQYRSRSRSRNNRLRQKPTVERWAHDRANYDREPAPTADRWAKDTSAMNMSNHRRSDAFDQTANSSRGSLLARMTKDGRPVAPQGRSLADRITRDTDESSYGRLKDDDSAPSYADLSEPTRKRGLAGRISRDDDDIQIHGRSRELEGINIRGSASQGGFSIRGVAGGA
ncbi:hypothetical protein BU23DRAFT_597317 [Bimuria novae-zelandiae CBS 107.79]|uniref:Uncharacterized protein n=1 Tax=Bimuria novae-zelandiae CBS 107.79 TaxID=1447943 RepID=A0A6A5VH02_9PLEO|nr:hypothetical protein BU23DRAFT_597317 [Bimuria novae-zelandiae CBS 107.79]